MKITIKLIQQKFYSFCNEKVAFEGDHLLFYIILVHLKFGPTSGGGLWCEWPY